jgi:NADPH-dependent 2,4-dienoyl-CoA reductase/sulfur reductase-like enzyme
MDGVAAGPKAAARARRRDPNTEITIVDGIDLFSYAGCGMPIYMQAYSARYATISVIFSEYLSKFES